MFSESWEQELSESLRIFEKLPMVAENGLFQCVMLLATMGDMHDTEISVASVGDIFSFFFEADGRRAMSGVLWKPMCAIYSELDQWYIFGQTGWKMETEVFTFKLCFHFLVGLPKNVSLV